MAGKQGLLSVVTDAIDRAVIEAGRELKVVATIAVGYNNIDVAAARERGIIVTNTPDVLTESTADLTWALILGITRRIVEGDRLVRRGSGRDGRSTSCWDRICAASSSASSASDGSARRSPPARRPSGCASRTPAGVPSRQRPASSCRSIGCSSTSDVVSLHCPLTPETTHLINQTTLARMKRSAYLISAARGPVVDEAALAWALENRMIAGAALDVYEKEPEFTRGCSRFENVLLSPHLGSSAIETRTTMIQLAAENIIAVLSGQPPLTPIT